MAAEYKCLVSPKVNTNHSNTSDAGLFLLGGDTYYDYSCMACVDAMNTLYREQATNRPPKKVVALKPLVWPIPKPNDVI